MRRIPRIVGKFQPRQRETTLPGWDPVLVERNGVVKPEWRCPVLRKMPFQNEWRRCSFTSSKDRALKHDVHVFWIPREQDPLFPADFHQRHDEVTLEEIGKRLLGLIAEVAVETGLSAPRVSSPAFRSFGLAMLNIGRELARAGRSSQWVKSVPFYSAPVISAEIVKRGKIEHKKQMTDLKKIKFVNLIVDSGTVLSFHTLHVLAGNPYEDGLPILFDLQEDSHFDKAQYELAFQEQFEVASRDGITICSVIIDNLPAQVSGLLNCLDSPNPKIRAVLYVPCFAHMSNLVFQKARKEISPLRDEIDRIESVIRFLRTPDAISQIGARCPKTVPTRWICIYDSLS